MSEADGQAEFCSGCPLKGDYCGPFNHLAPIAIDKHEHRRFDQEVDVEFSDSDGMPTNTLELEGRKLREVTLRRNGLPYFKPDADRFALEAIESVRYGLVARVRRCSGPGVPDASGDARFSRPDCPAVNRRVVYKLLNNSREQTAE
jgi:hypothetical protein